MYALVAMGLALTLLIVLLRFRVRIGRSMILSSLALAILLGVSPAAFWQTVVYEWHNKTLGQTTPYLFVTLTALVMLVNMLGVAMKETAVSARLAPALEGLFGSRRVALLGIPLMMGMLPTPGGIMLSAPMVRDLGDHTGLDRARSAAINYFFRHQWETVWPLFPAVPLVQSMFGISAFALVSHNIAVVLSGLLAGLVFLLLFNMPPRNRQQDPHSRFTDNLRSFAHVFWPIALVAGLYAGLNLSPAAGMLLAVLLFLAVHKVPLTRWAGIFRQGAEFDFVLLILGALLFKLNLEAGGAIPAVVAFFSEINMPVHFIIFFLPMIVAFLTGLTMPTVAITFPFLIPFIGTGPQAKIALQTLAFSGLICGLLTTPVHLCLALSAVYFDAPLTKIIMKLLIPVLFIAAAGVLMAIVLG